MENIATAQPGQIAFFIIGCLVVAVVIIVWLMTGVRHDSEPVTLDPIILAGQLWADILNWRPVPMSSQKGGALSFESNEDRPNSFATTTPATSNNALQSGATNSNELLIGQARALAAMVKAGKIGETEGIKMVFGVSPSSTNPRYQAARGALKDALARLESSAEYRQPDGTTTAATRPVTGRRTHA